MVADDEDPWKPYNLEIRVVDPVSFSSPYRSSHTTYNIQIKTNHPAFSLQYSEVRRRYSEFKWLQSVLQRHHPEREPPAIPARSLLIWNRFTHEFLESRRAELEIFIKKTIAIRCYLGEKALHLFLQSGLSTKEIELNLLGERADVIVPPTTAGGGSTSPCDIDSNNATNMCYAEEALSLLPDDGYGSSENNGAVHLESDGVEQIEPNGLPWFTSLSTGALEESSPVILINDTA